MPIAGRQRAREWETVWETLATMERVFGPDPDSRAVAAAVRSMRGAVQGLFRLWDAGAPMVWYNIGFGSDLVYALEDVGPVPAAMLAALSSIAGEQADTEAFIDTAEAAGYSSECCSADKAGIGAILKGLYPEPACIVGVNTPCDSQVSILNAMAECRPQVPFFAIDVPPYQGERAHRYVAGQLRELIPFLERHTGRRLDWDRLRATCERTNRTSEHLWQWMEWRSAVPCMQPSKLCAFTMVIAIALGGSEHGEALARELAADARAKAEGGAHWFEEKVRAIWYQDPVWWDLQLYDWMESELGLVIPMDVFGYYANEGLIDTASEETLLLGLARRMIDNHPMARQFRSTMDRYIGDYLVMHERFRADCGIFAGHVACKHAWGGLGLFQEALRRAGIPLLVFEFDMFDARVTPRRELEFQLQRFVNDVVLPRKARGGLRRAP
jgi:hypothetical protein